MERDQHAILTAVAGALGEGPQRAAINAMQAALTNPRTVLKALELLARLNGETRLAADRNDLASRK